MYCMCNMIKISKKMNKKCYDSYVLCMLCVLILISSLSQQQNNNHSFNDYELYLIPL